MEVQQMNGFQNRVGYTVESCYSKPQFNELPTRYTNIVLSDPLQNALTLNRNFIPLGL